MELAAGWSFSVAHSAGVCGYNCNYCCCAVALYNRMRDLVIALDWSSNRLPRGRERAQNRNFL